MTEYKCNTCGKTIIRHDGRSKTFKTHYCNQECMSTYIKTHGPLNTEERKKKNGHQFNCLLCGDKTKFNCLTGKYCDNCQKLATTYYRYKTKQNMRFKDFLYLAIERNLKVHKRAAYILLQKFNEVH